jgi:hypothetical protein
MHRTVVMSSPSPRRLRAVLPLLMMLVSASCGDGSVTGPSTLIEAKQRWAQTAPAAYQITVSRACFCAVDVNRPVIVTVRDGQVESRRYADNGADVDPRIASAYPTVDELFAIIESAIARQAAQVDVTYDAARGFPVTVALDGAVGIADDEQFYGTRDFAVR